MKEGKVGIANTDNFWKGFTIKVNRKMGSSVKEGVGSRKSLFACFRMSYILTGMVIP